MNAMDNLDRYYQAKMQHRHVTRRGLFRGLFGGVKKSLPENHTLHFRTIPRPPNAQLEPLFLAYCDGCGKCQDACHEAVINIVNEKATLNLSDNSCSLCGECVQVCPTQALNKTQTTIMAELQPKFEAHCDRKFGYCELCVESCPSQAITINDTNNLQLNNEICLGCGQCQQQCPSAAITLTLQPKKTSITL
jgi:ferredoxin-type protein NapF